MTRQPLSRDKLQVVLACVRHATNTFGPTPPIFRLVSAKRRLPARTRRLERRNGDHGAVRRPRLVPRRRVQGANPT
jgi:hypothetical protein